MIKILTNILLATLLIACSSGTVIPDEKLALIFHDAFLANASTGHENKIYNKDSMLLYEPIFDKYGYTQEDVQYTIGNFSKRKSARLSDVVERAIDLLEEEGIALNREVMILDTIDVVSQRRLSCNVLERERINLYDMRDTSLTHLTINDIKPGRYNITFDYLVDSLDKTSGSYNTRIWVERDESKAKFYNNNNYLSRGSVNRFSHTITTFDPYDRMRLRLGDPRITTNKKVHLTIKRLRVTYVPHAKEATNSLFNEFIHFRFFSDELLPPPAKDSL